MTKIISKSLLHILGVRTCVYFKCLMNNNRDYVSNTIRLCPICIQKLYYITSEDIVDRYMRLAEFMHNSDDKFFMSRDLPLYINKLK